MSDLLARLDAVLKAAPNRRAAEWAQENAAHLLEEVSETIRREVRGLIVEGLKRGLGQRDLAADLEALGFEPARASLIARNEYRAAVEGARQAAWEDAQEAGRLSERAKKVWETRSADPCPLCLPMDGQTQFVELPFDTALGPVESPPLHPGCLCRSSLTER